MALQFVLCRVAVLKFSEVQLDITGQIGDSRLALLYLPGKPGHRIVEARQSDLTPQVTDDLFPEQLL
ncbi:MAG: hypothetical protein HYU51_07410 [Candidatus Rokubacteria bacterium]|nr:hypothetical protein [Candidatus Rokubacteria bacterium]